MDSLDEDTKKKAIIAERDRLRHIEAYRTNEARRLYHVEYERMRLADPIYRERRNALQREANKRKKALKNELNDNKENLPVKVNWLIFNENDWFLSFAGESQFEPLRSISDFCHLPERKNWNVFKDNPH